MKNNHINYVELQATDLDSVKEFYSSVFGWTFTDFGPDYTAFADSGLDGGFAKVKTVTPGGSLVVLYHKDLEHARDQVKKGGGAIVRDIFSFPGGRRFHFTDPAGNELAIWSDN